MASSVRAGRRALRVAIIALAAAAAAPAAVFAEIGPESRFRVVVEADQAGRDRISARGLDVAGHDLQAGRVELIVRADELAWLHREGFEPFVLERRDAPRPLGAADGADVPLADSRYTSPAELDAFLAQVHADHPSITRVETIGTTHQGRPIKALMISDNAGTDEDELAILFSGAHHAREVMTPEIVMDTIDQLTDLYGIDPAVTGYVDSFAIWCVPIVNPDGVAIVHEEDDFWRKNARDNDGNSTIDGNDGVDLNRNYEWGWGNQCNGSSDVFSNQTYRGPSEGSEPETQAMVLLGRRTRPVFDVEYHSYGEDVLYSMSCDPIFSPELDTIDPDPPPNDNRSISRVIAEAYASEIVQADGGLGYSPAPYGSRVDGTGRDHQYSENGAIAFVVEVNNSLEGGFHPDYGVYRDATVQGHRPAWRWLLDRIEGPAIGGVVTDAATGLPLVAEVSLDEMTLPDGRRVHSRPDTGRYHLIVVPGDYTLRVSAHGYEPAVVPVTVGASWVATDVPLVPTGATILVHEDMEESAAVAQWTAGAAGDNANDGVWAWGEPQGTHTGDVPTSSLEFYAPRFDASPGSGARAFVTGNAVAPAFDDDDVDKGRTTLTSPSYDLSGWYGVTARWSRWLRVDSAQDGLRADVSADGGQSWITLEDLSASTSTADASPAWVPVSFRLDDLVAPGPDVRFRFVAEDAGSENVVEAAIDELEVAGFSLAIQGDVAGVTVEGKTDTVVSWAPVPGGAGASYDVVRGDLAGLAGGAGGVTLGALACVEDDSSDTDTAGSPDGTTPTAGSGLFYLVRFQLGFSVGGYGFGSEGGTRGGSGGCP